MFRRGRRALLDVALAVRPLRKRREFKRVQQRKDGHGDRNYLMRSIFKEVDGGAAKEDEGNAAYAKLPFDERRRLYEVAFPHLRPKEGEVVHVHSGYKVQVGLILHRLPTLYEEPAHIQRYRLFRESWRLRTKNHLTVDDVLLTLKLPIIDVDRICTASTSKPETALIGVEAERTIVQTPGIKSDTVVHTEADGIGCADTEESRGGSEHFWKRKLQELVLEPETGGPLDDCPQAMFKIAPKSDERQGRPFTSHEYDAATAELSRRLHTLLVWYPRPDDDSNVKKGIPGVWTVPITTVLREDNTLNAAINRLCSKEFGVHFKPYFPSPSPAGFALYRFCRNDQKSGLKGRKVLLFRGYYVPGTCAGAAAELAETASAKHVEWVPHKDLKHYLDTTQFQAISVASLFAPQ